MKITILGTRGEIKLSAPYHSKKSGILIDGKILLDIGDSRFLQYKPKAILITHLHPDHAYFVRSGETPEIPADLFAPEPYKNMPLTLTKKPFTLNGYIITPIPTIHSAKVVSNAYLIEHKGTRVLYTGDMIWIEKKYHDLLGKLDLVITEASFMRKGGRIRKDPKTGTLFGHTGVPNLISLFKKHTNTILFVHFGSWFYKNMTQSRAQFKQLAKEQDMQLIVGYDGLNLNLESKGRHIKKTLQ